MIKTILKWLGWIYLVIFVIGCVKWGVDWWQESRPKKAEPAVAEQKAAAPEPTDDYTLADIIGTYVQGDVHIEVRPDGYLVKQDRSHISIYRIQSLEDNLMVAKGEVRFAPTGSNRQAEFLAMEPFNGTEEFTVRRGYKNEPERMVLAQGTQAWRADAGSAIGSVAQMMASLYLDEPSERLRMNVSESGRATKFFLTDSVGDYRVLAGRDEVRVALAAYAVETTDGRLCDWDEAQRRTRQFDNHTADWLDGWRAGRLVALALLGLALVYILSHALSPSDVVCRGDRFTGYGWYVVWSSLLLLGSSLWYFVSIGPWALWWFDLPGAKGGLSWFGGLMGLIVWCFAATGAIMRLDAAVARHADLDEPRGKTAEAVCGYLVTGYIIFWVINAMMADRFSISREMVLGSYGLLVLVCLPRNIARLREADGARLLVFVAYVLAYPLRYPLFLFTWLFKGVGEFAAIVKDDGHGAPGRIRVQDNNGHIHDLYYESGMWKDTITGDTWRGDDTNMYSNSGLFGRRL